MSDAIRLGTRGSTLAVAQSTVVANAISKRSGREVELVRITTQGDTSRASLASLGGVGVFTTALRDALAAGECDVVVHSLKDLPISVSPQFTIVAHPKRADARDALISRDGLTLEQLRPGARVGTGSPRRIAQLLARRPDIVPVEIRGNIDTRISKVTGGLSGEESGDDLDAVVLAAAGLTRIGRLEESCELLSLTSWPTAAGQGALAVETLAGADGVVTTLASTFAALDHSSTRVAVLAERLTLAGLESGCHAPVGITAFLEDGLLFLSANVYSLDGEIVLTSSHAVTPDTNSLQDLSDAALEVSDRVIEELLGKGASSLVSPKE